MYTRIEQAKCLMCGAKTVILRDNQRIEKRHNASSFPHPEIRTSTRCSAALKIIERFRHMRHADG